LFYVALTRAKDFLEVCVPLKYYVKKRGLTDRHSYAQLTRFLPDSIVDRFERVSLEPRVTPDAKARVEAATKIKKQIAQMWS
jgi:ATP-dependent DNA helicase UvrD/PcrA